MLLMRRQYLSHPLPSGLKVTPCQSQLVRSDEVARPVAETHSPVLKISRVECDWSLVARVGRATLRNIWNLPLTKVSQGSLMPSRPSGAALNTGFAVAGSRAFKSRAEMTETHQRP